MPSEEETQQQSENSEESQDNSSSLGSEEEDENKASEEEDEEPIFHPHKGKIMQILQYIDISSLSFDKSYEEPTGSGKVELPLSLDDSKYIYDGVSCKLKVRRDTDRQFSDTGLEEIFKKEEDIHLREHYPTTEMLIDNQSLFEEKEFVSEDYKDWDVVSTLVSRSASDDGLYGFVTEVNRSQSGSEISLKDWGYCLEDTTIELSFSGMLRSQVIEEVAKSYGLVPIVDLSGLDDDVVGSWTNKKTMGGGATSSDESSNSDLNESSEWDDCTSIKLLADEYGPRSGAAGPIPDEDPKYTATIGKTGTNYAEFVKGCTTPEAVMKKLRPRMNYRRYSDNDPQLKCASQGFEAMAKQGINCGDSSRLVKCCMDVCGIPCMCVHTPGHYYNAVKKGNKWYTTDLCRIGNIKSAKETQTLGV